MPDFQMTDEQVVEYRQKYLDLAAPHTNSETVIVAAPFRRGGAAATMAIGTARLGFLARAGVNLYNKKQAGGLPQRMLIAVTDTTLYAFELTWKSGEFRIAKEAAVWDRSAIRTTIERGRTMTSLTIESPAENEKATIVGMGIVDDPISQEVMNTLAATTALAA